MRFLFQAGHVQKGNLSIYYFALFFRPRAAPAPPINPSKIPKIREKLSINSLGSRANALNTRSITRITREV